jgi:hypothetical protein
VPSTACYRCCCPPSFRGERLLGCIPISGGNQLSDALDEAQGDRAGADALIDITVEAVSKYFILWSHGCTVVRATAVSVN